MGMHASRPSGVGRASLFLAWDVPSSRWWWWFSPLRRLVWPLSICLPSLPPSFLLPSVWVGGVVVFPPSPCLRQVGALLAAGGCVPALSASAGAHSRPLPSPLFFVGGGVLCGCGVGCWALCGFCGWLVVGCVWCGGGACGVCVLWLAWWWVAALVAAVVGLCAALWLAVLLACVGVVVWCACVVLWVVWWWSLAVSCSVVCCSWPYPRACEG